MPPLRDRIPVWIAGNQARTIRLAAEIGDGVMCQPIWSVEWATREGADALALGLRGGGRRRADVHVQLAQFASIDDDPRQAVEDARPTVAFYAGAEAYEPFFAAHGYRDVARRCQEGVKRGDYLSTAHHVPDEMVERFVLCGSADRVRARFAPLWELGDSFWVVPPLFGVGPERQAVLGGAIAAAFWS